MKAFLKKIPKDNLPKSYQLEAMEKAIKDILMVTGFFVLNIIQKISKLFFKVMERLPNQRWKGALEWQVVPDDNDMRILTKDLGNDKKMIGFTHEHYKRIFDIVIKELD
ncbi:hypothetical protein [Xenorhabdus szentirmaii]|uniref:hypothetical protein n=1 Tax=Xenorhabdus szentirmaii TaxID=290112 RepID=UPI000A04E783|nr:hypothetical protein [Xenorhabdus szentirmaii]